MLTYSYVDGASFVGLVVEVRDHFWALPAWDSPDDPNPNSVWSVAIELYSRMCADGRIAVLVDLLQRNEDLVLERPASEIFRHAATSRDYLVDLVVASVEQVLLRDDSVATEDARRAALAAEAQDETD